MAKTFTEVYDSWLVYPQKPFIPGAHRFKEATGAWNVIEVFTDETDQPSHSIHNDARNETA